MDSGSGKEQGQEKLSIGLSVIIALCIIGLFS